MVADSPAQKRGLRRALLAPALLLLTWVGTGVAHAIPFGGITTVALTGEQAPGAPAGAEFASVELATLNANGKAAFAATLSVGTGGVTASDDEGVWGPGGGGSLSLLAREGSQAPGAPAGAVYEQFGDPALNDGNEIAFLANLRTGSGGVTSSDDQGIFGPDPGLTLLERKGSQAPDTGAGTLFSLLDTPRLNGNDEVLFNGFLLAGTGDATAGSDRGVWGPDGVGGLEVFAREGDQAPGTPAGALFNVFFEPSLNDAGETSFVASLKTGAGGVTSSNDLGLFGPDSSGNLDLIARKGSQAPGTPVGATFSTLGEPVLNEQGEVAFLGFLTPGSGGVTSGSDRGIWGPDGAGGVTVLAREGDLAPGGPGSAEYGFFEAPVLNDASEIAFIGRFKAGTGGVTSADNDAVWGPDDAGNIRLLARQGNQVGDLAAGIRFDSFMDIALNDAGVTVFLASLEQGSGGVDAANDEAIFIALADQDAMTVVRKGDLLEVASGDFRTITGLAFAGGADDQRRGRQTITESQLAFYASFSDGSEGIFLLSIPEPSTHLLMVLGLVGIATLPRRWR